MAKETGQYTNKELLADLWRWLGPDKSKYIGLSILRVFTDIAGLYPAFAAAEIITFLTKYQSGAPIDYLVWIVGSMIVISVARSVAILFFLTPIKSVNELHSVLPWRQSITY